jgi:hypothetical protein
MPSSRSEKAPHYVASMSIHSRGKPPEVALHLLESVRVASESGAETHSQSLLSSNSVPEFTGLPPGRDGLSKGAATGAASARNLKEGVF